MKHVYYSIRSEDFEHNYNKLLPKFQADGHTNIEKLLECKKLKVHWKDRDIGHYIINVLLPGDSIAVVSITELGTSAEEVLEICHEAISKNISIQSFLPSMSVNSSCNSRDALNFAMQVANTLPEQKSSKKPGRPKGTLAKEVMLDAYKDQIIDMINKNVSKASIAKIIGCSRPTLYAYLLRIGIK